MANFKRRWFKFYGQDYLTDPKMLALNSVERNIWITLLCLASAAEEPGVIKNLTEGRAMILSGVTCNNDEWEVGEETFKKLENLKMISIDGETITVINFNKRQEPETSDDPDAIRERVAKHRENKIKKQDTTECNDQNPVTCNDKRREEKKREEKKEERHILYLKKIPEEDIKEFLDKYNCSKNQIESKADDLFNYCKAKGRIYKDYRAFLRNAIKKDFGSKIREEPKEWQKKHEVDQEKLAKFRSMKKEILKL